MIDVRSKYPSILLYVMDDKNDLKSIQDARNITFTQKLGEPEILTLSTGLNLRKGTRIKSVICDKPHYFVVESEDNTGLTNCIGDLSVSKLQRNSGLVLAFEQ